MSANTVLKKVFSKIKFDGTNKDEILKLLNENRHLIIKETFRNKKDLYDNYCQTSRLLEKGDNSPCRLKGYYFDPNRKSKATGYNFASRVLITLMMKSLILSLLLSLEILLKLYF